MIAAAVVAWARGLAAAPALGDEVVIEPGGPTKASAYGGRLAWSQFDASSGRFVLMSSVGGEASRVAIKSQAVPFDADVGPDRDGKPVVVYSRCRQPATQLDPLLSMVTYVASGGCDVYVYDFARRRERRLGAFNTRRGSEFLPSIWRGRLAFARRSPGRATRVVVADSRGRVIKRTGGPVGAGSIAQSVRVGQVAGPLAIDLRGARVAYAWAYPTGGVGCPTGDRPIGGIERTQVRVSTPRADTVLARACSSRDPASALGVAWWGSSVIYAVNHPGSDGITSAQILRSTATRGPGTVIATVTDGPVTGVAYDGRLLAVTNRYEGRPMDRIIAPVTSDGPNS